LAEVQRLIHSPNDHSGGRGDLPVSKQMATKERKEHKEDGFCAKSDFIR
jgi:hypothetical protein